MELKKNSDDRVFTKKQNSQQVRTLFSTKLTTSSVQMPIKKFKSIIKV